MITKIKIITKIGKFDRLNEIKMKKRYSPKVFRDEVTEHSCRAQDSLRRKTDY